MPSTTVLIAAGIVAAIVLGLLVAWSSRMLYVRQVRRALVGLIGRREAIHASQRAVRGVLGHLAEASVEELTAFASDASNEDRRSICDVHERMLIVADDLRAARLPKAVWTSADLLERAARTLAEESGRICSPESAEGSLDGLATIDLHRADDAIAAGDGEVQRMCEVYRVKDPSVYGGGLYI